MARGGPKKSSGGEIQDLIVSAYDGRFAPVQLLVGPERFLVERAIGLLRKASLGDGPSGFNDDVFHAKAKFDVSRVVSAVRTLPMMSAARFVLVRDVDKLKTADAASFLPYLADPSDTTCLVFTAEKLDRRGKLAKALLKAGAWWEAQPPKTPEVRRFVSQEAKRRRHVMANQAIEALIDAAGEDLALLDDAIERLSLFVGDGEAIGVDAVQACISRAAVDSIWNLVDGVGARDAKRVLQAASSLLADREPALRILAMVSRQLRMVARMREALAAGQSDNDAARAAGAPSFKARELKAAARRYNASELQVAFATLADADLALKGSRRPPERVLEEALLQLCIGRPRIRQPLARHQRTYR